MGDAGKSNRPRKVVMGCGGSEEKNETMVADDSGVEIVEESPPDGWLKVDVYVNTHVYRMYVGPTATVKNVMDYLQKCHEAEFTVEEDKVTGLTSTWALEDGGLVFCEDDNIFELDGWDGAVEKGGKIKLVAAT